MTPATGSRSELPSSEPLIRVNPRPGLSGSNLADPTKLVSRSSSTCSTVGENVRLATSSVPLFFTQPGNQQLQLNPHTEPFLESSYEYAQSSQSLGSRFPLAGPNPEDDLTLPLELERNTDRTSQVYHSRMHTGLYNHGTEMVISASHLDRQINSFIQETTIMSPQLADMVPNSPSRHQTISSNTFSRKQDSDNDTEDGENDGEDDLGSCAPHPDLQMAGSRPPSRAFSVGRRSRAPSACSSFVEREVESQTPGYLFLNEVPPLRIKKSTVANHPSLHSPNPKGKSRSHSGATSHRRPVYQQHFGAQRDMESHPKES